VNIKAQGLINAGKWISDEHGHDALSRVVQACGPAVRERYASAIPMMWHPADELEEFLREAVRELGPDAAEEIGAAGATANLSSALVRFAIYIARPDQLIPRVTRLWSQFNDQGEMQLLAVTAQECVYEVKGVERPRPLFCATITGWGRALCNALGMIEPVSRHTHCRARGDKRCVWRVTAKGTRSPVLDYRHPDCPA
jgi:hypothetical protein